ncbi:MAG: diaminopimelate decarboxylase [Myxococcales bacterium]|nr:diaminopimelate decarboxylase [Myxococcales bacterium]
MSGIPASESFVHVDGELRCDGVSLAELADSYGTPAYVYSSRVIERAYREIDQALAFTPHLIAYAVKANGNLAVLRTLARLGSGADIVSGGELARALEAGIPPSRIVYSGVGKTPAEIAEALLVGIRSIHVESEPELEVVEAVARELGKTAKVSLRVNPDVDPQTHPYIATGLHSTKFGIEIDVARRLIPKLVESPHLALEGLAMHIGSQLGSPAPLEEAVTLLGRFALEAMEAGAPLESLDVGGGWSLNYGHEAQPYPPASAFGEAIRRGLEASGVASRGLTIVTEPGRYLVGDAGVLLTRVLYVKDGPKKRFVIVDAAMTELIRPSLYGAYHAIVPVVPRKGEARVVDVVGPVCESGDFLAKDRLLGEVKQGDLLAIRGAGAYAREMASMYNARLPAPEILVVDGRAKLVRKRPGIEALWAHEID